MDISSEDVLNAWLRLTTTVNNVRLAGELPYYELLICGILYRNQKSGAPGSLTATELCGETRMLKSQMNRTLNSMEKKGLIFSHTLRSGSASGVYYLQYGTGRGV